MIDKKQILKMAEHVFRRSSGIPDKKLMHPKREWAIGMVLFAVILVGGSILSSWSFAQYRNIDTQTGEASIQIPKYNETLIKNVLEEYKQREVIFNTYVTDTSLVPVIEVVATSSTNAESPTDDVASTTVNVENPSEIDTISATELE